MAKNKNLQMLDDMECLSYKLYTSELVKLSETPAICIGSKFFHNILTWKDIEAINSVVLIQGIGSMSFRFYHVIN